MTLNNFVDKIYCINLDRRPDRWARCEEIFKKHDLSVERVSAVDKRTLSGGTLPLGALGVLRSNLGIIKGAKSDGLSKICIFEDDIELDDDFNEKFSEYVYQVPDTWSFLYLGCNNKKPPVPVGTNINRITKAYGAYAVMIQKDIFDTLIEEFSKEDQQLDFVYAKLQSQHPVYVVNPFLAWVRDDYSDINEKFINVSHLRQDKYEKQN